MGGEGARTSFRSINPRLWFYLVSSDKTITRKKNTLQHKYKSFKNTKHLFNLFPDFYYKARQRAKWAAKQVAIILADHKQINKSATMKNQHRNAALGPKLI